MSLSSILLSTMEKVLEHYIRDVHLLHNPIQVLYFEYQQGKPTETAIHHVVTVIEKSQVAMLRTNILSVIGNWTLGIWASRVI